MQLSRDHQGSPKMCKILNGMSKFIIWQNETRLISLSFTGGWLKQSHKLKDLIFISLIC